MPRRKQPLPESNRGIVDQTFEDILADRFSRYSKHIIQERALPDARDGLKPVQRRILWAMFEAHNTYDHPYHKSAKTVGNVIGNYHPHGDASVYDALVRLSQEWKIRTPLVDMQGNNGSIDDDPAAAMRYTEARLSKLAGYLLEDIDKETVSWAPNFSDEKLEPTVLPARYPNLLVNGISGIAAGYATNIPPHNLSEVLQAAIYRIDHPDSTVEELMEFVKGPDFPTGGIAMGEENIAQSLKTGKGKVAIRARATIESTRTIQQIVITEIPYEVVKSNLVKKITDIYLNKKVDGILDVRDESGREGLRIVIDLKKEANAKAILDYLYKNTELQVNCSYNVIAIVDKSPVQLSLDQMLDAFIRHREDVILKRTDFSLRARNKRSHIVEGMQKAISILDEVIALIRASKNKAESKQKLIETYGFSELQAEAIVMLQLYRLSNTDIVALNKEAKALEEEIRQLRLILEDKPTRNALMIQELKEIDDEFGLERKTTIEKDIAEIVINPRDMVAKEDWMIALSKEGYGKKSSMRSYNSSASFLPGIREGDNLVSFGQAFSLDNVVILTNKGRLLSLPVFKLEEGRWKDGGFYLGDLIRLDPNEKIVGSWLADENSRAQQLVMVTQKNRIARISIPDIMQAKSSPLMSLEDEDRIADAFFVKSPDHELAIYTKNGRISRIPLDALRLFSGKTKGVKGFELDEGDQVSGIFEMEPSDLIALNSNGEIKRFHYSEIPHLKNKISNRFIFQANHKGTYDMEWVMPLQDDLEFWDPDRMAFPENKVTQTKIGKKGKTGILSSEAKYYNGTVEKLSSLEPTIRDGELKLNV